MEIWIVYIIWHIIAAVILGIVDYNLIQWLYKNAVTASIVTCSFFLVFSFIFLATWIEWNIFAISMWILSGIFSIISSYIYSLCFEKKMSPGFVLSIWKIQMVFAFIFWVFFLGEELTFMQLLWHGIIFFSALFLALFHGNITWKKNDIFLPLLWAVLFSISFMIIDPIYERYDFKTVFTGFCFWFGLWAPYLIFFHKKWKTFIKEAKKNWRKFLMFWIFTETIALIEFGWFHLAMKHWPLSLVVFLKETYVVLLIIVSVIGAYFYPKFFPDGWKSFNIQKLWIICIMLIWVYLALI